MPTNGLRSANATACAALKPTSRAIGKPGPCVAATASSCVRRRFRFAQRGLRDGNQIPQMFARGQFRHDAAVFGVQFDLRGDGVGQDSSVAHDGGAGFVAGSFKGQKVMRAGVQLVARLRINRISRTLCRKLCPPVLSCSSRDFAVILPPFCCRSLSVAVKQDALEQILGAFELDVVDVFDA